MKNREIIVPLEKESQMLLDVGVDEINSEKIILSDEQFKLLYDSNIFEFINRITGTLIDDYEDDCIVDSINLIEVKKFLEFKLKENSSEEPLRNLISKLLRLIEKAIESQTGVFFFF